MAAEQLKTNMHHQHCIQQNDGKNKMNIRNSFSYLSTKYNALSALKGCQHRINQEGPHHHLHWNY
jgi:hypothetical protein